MFFLLFYFLTGFLIAGYLLHLQRDSINQMIDELMSKNNSDRSILSAALLLVIVLCWPAIIINMVPHQ